MKYIITLISSLFFLQGQSQLLTSMIPKEAGLVVEIDLNSIQENLGNKVSSIDKNFKVKILDSYDSRLRFSDLLNAKTSGINMSKKAYYFKDGQYTSWIFPLTNQQQFKSFLESEMSFDSVEMTNTENIQMMLGNAGVFIKGNTAIVMTGPYIRTPYLSSYSAKRKLNTYLDDQEEPVLFDDKVAQKISDLILDHAKDNDYTLPSDFRSKLEAEIKKNQSSLTQRTDNDASYEMTIDEVEEAVAAAEEAAVDVVEESAVDVVEESAVDVVEEVTVDAVEEAAEEAVVDAIEETVPESYSYSTNELPANRLVIQAFNNAWNYYEREVKKIYKKVEIKRTSEMGWNYFSQNTSQSIESNFEFSADFSHQHDIGVWVSSEKVLSGIKMELLGLGSYFRGQNTTAYLDIVENKIKFSSKVQANPQMKNYQTIESKRVNKKFKCYLPPSTSGIYAMNLDLEQSYSWYQDFYSHILKETGVKENIDFSGFVDLFDLMIDNDVLLNTWKGDGLVALTGMTSFISTKRKYVYDSIEYKRSWQTVPDTMNIPQVLGMFSLGKKDYAYRTLDALVKLHVLKKQGDVYTVDLNYNDYDKKKKGIEEMWSFYIQDNILFFTNSSYGKAEKTEGAPSNINTLLKNQGNFFYWNHAAAVENLKVPKGMIYEMSISSQYFKEAYISTYQSKSGDVMLDADFSFSEENKANALIQLLEMVTKLN